MIVQIFLGHGLLLRTIRFLIDHGELNAGVLKRKRIVRKKTEVWVIRRKSYTDERLQQSAGVQVWRLLCLE
jgi:hypothetical protein